MHFRFCLGPNAGSRAWAGLFLIFLSLASSEENKHAWEGSLHIICLETFIVNFVISLSSSRQGHSRLIENDKQGRKEKFRAQGENYVDPPIISFHFEIYIPEPRENFGAGLYVPFHPPLVRPNDKLHSQFNKSFESDSACKLINDENWSAIEHSSASIMALFNTQELILINKNCIQTVSN